jgi:hypothetical protein
MPADYNNFADSKSPANYKNNDQAQLLRQLAQPPESTKSEVGDEPSVLDEHFTLRHAPHVVLISELPSLQHGVSLALHMARRLSEQEPGTLLVDLAPAASRLPSAIAATPEAFVGWGSKIQPFWSTSAHGRTLTNWTETRPAHLDILAQPAGDLPSIDQMPRLCEQLIRQIGNQGRIGADNPATYKSVIMLSECVGVPLDSVCWQAADTVILLHDSEVVADQLWSILAARLVTASRGQRLLLLQKRMPTLRDWTSRRRMQRRDDVPCELINLLPIAERWDVIWPHVQTRLSRSMRATANELVEQVLPSAIPTGRARQAS